MISTPAPSESASTCIAGVFVHVKFDKERTSCPLFDKHCLMLMQSPVAPEEHEQPDEEYCDKVSYDLSRMHVSCMSDTKLLIFVALSKFYLAFLIQQTRSFDS